MNLITLVQVVLLGFGNAHLATSLNPLAASLIGANAHSPTPKSIAFLHDVGGFRWIRNDVPWPVVEINKGEYTFDAIDPYFHAIRDHGMGLISILSTSNKNYQQGQDCTTSDCIEGNKNYAVALAKHFQDVNVWWELYNEPNTNAFAKNASLYGHIASIIGPALHSAVPNASFVGPASGNTGFASGWLQEIFETGVLAHFDRLTIHPYRSDAPEMAFNDLKQVQDLVAEYAPFETTNKPIVSGEWGYGVTTLGNSYLKQAEMLARVILITTSTLLQPSIWYQVCDPDQGDGQEGIMNCTGEMGNRTFSPLPSFYAAQTMHKVFRNDGKPPSEPIDEALGMRFVRRIPVFQNGVDTSDDWVLLYRASGDSKAIVLVAWTSSDFEHVVRLPAVYEQGECWKVTTMLGDTTTPNICHDPRGLHVNVSSAPMYLTRIIQPPPTTKATHATKGVTRACSDSTTKTLPYCNVKLSTEARVSDLLSRLTLAEKLSMMDSNQQPIPRLSIPGYNWGNECLHGVKTQAGPKKGATIFPQPSAFGATFDDALIHTVAAAISDESKALSNWLGVTSLQNCWSPNINIFRDPRWGRGSETYGEDVTLTSKMTQVIRILQLRLLRQLLLLLLLLLLQMLILFHVRPLLILILPANATTACTSNTQAYVTGIQGTARNSGPVKIISVCKHFMGYSLEEADGESRFWFDALINAQDLSATYTPAWNACVKAGARGVMCSYNKINGVPMCANEGLLTMLRQNLTYTGHVVSDCGAVNNIQETQLYHNDTPAQGAADALNAGTDLNCGDGYDVLNESLELKLTTSTAIDLALSRTLKGRFDLSQFDPIAQDPWSNITIDQVNA
jgi:beta-glucosidase-like glycosyl hydrolase